jgi:hypothetical protein
LGREREDAGTEEFDTDAGSRDDFEFKLAKLDKWFQFAEERRECEVLRSFVGKDPE